MSRLEALIAEGIGLEGDPVLRHMFESILPHERDIAGIGGLEPP